MGIFSFWSALEPGRRFLYLVFAFFLLAALGLAVYGYFYGTETIFPLVKLADLYPAEVRLFSSSPLLTPMHIKTNAYLVSEQYGIGGMQLPIWGTWVYFVGLAAAMAFFWALISTFKRIPYFVGVGLGMLWLSTFNLDLLGIFSETSRTLLFIALAVLGITSYIFQAFYQRLSLFGRFLVFAGLLLVLIGLLLYYSPLSAALTALHVVQYGTLGSLIASFLFMVLVAYENLHGLLWFNTQAQQPGRRFGLVQFMIISLLYLGTLLLLYLDQTGIFTFGFAGVDALLIFLFSAVIGFWGLKQRQGQYARFFRFETEVLPLYLVLALLTLLNLGYACLMANDPLVQAYRGAVVMTHLAYGSTFLIYLITNFAHLIRQKLRVYRVVYDPKRLPFFVVYLAGSVLLVVLFLRAQYSVYYSSQAGYYNYLGDLYRQTEEQPLLAEQFYLEGRLMAYGNQRSSLSLADMYHQGNMRTLEMQQLRELLNRKPSPDVYLRLANLYTSSADLFAHIEVLQEGTQKYPTYAPLLNNLGLLYSTTTFTDSAAHYLDGAFTHSSEPEVIKANQLAFLSRHNFTQQALAFSEKFQYDAYGPLQTNRLAIALINGKIDSSFQLPPSQQTDSVLTTQTFAHLYLRQLAATTFTKDTTALVELEKVLRQEENEVFAQDLTILKAFQQQRLGKPIQAKQTMEFMAANSSRTAGYYYDILGQWMLQADLYTAAANYFDHAAELGYGDARLHTAVALALAGETDDAAQIALQAANITGPQAAQNKGGTQLAIATQLTTEQAINAPDSLKVQFLQLRSASLPLEELESVANQITTQALAPSAALPLVKRYLQEEDLVKASQQLQVHFPASFPENSLKSKANVLAAELWWKAEQFQVLEKNLPTLYFAPQNAGAPHYYLALLAQRNKNPQAATNHYNTLLRVAPWFERGQLAAANFFINQKKPLRAYDLLLEAMDYNTTSPAIRKAYVKVAISQGFENYALQAMEQLETMVTPEEYRSFKNEIDAQMQQQQNLQQEW